MKYEVWVRVAGLEFQLPCKSEEEAKFMVGMLKEVRDPANDFEWAINDLNEGCTLQVG